MNHRIPVRKRVKTSRLVRVLFQAKGGVQKCKKEENPGLEKELSDQEEKSRRRAHIQEVTSMDLPMDWENVFNADPRSQGVHTDSIPDALVICLTTLEI